MALAAASKLSAPAGTIKVGIVGFGAIGGLMRSARRVSLTTAA